MSTDRIRFSPSTGCGYPLDIHYDVLPSDLIDISHDEFLTLTNGRAEGKVIKMVSGGLVLADPPAPDPADRRAGMVLTRHQVLTGMLADGLITPDEGVAASTLRVPPAAVEAIMAAMPQPAQSLARMKFANFAEAHRTDPMVAMFAAAATPPLTDAQMDDFFTRHAAI